MSDLDLSTPKRIHIVGVGGAGMSAIATVLHAMGHSVSGSDLKESLSLERLRGLGVTVEIGHRAENLRDAQLVTYSTAIAESNVELEVARQRGLVTLRRSEVLAAVTRLRKTVAVSGTHGKTTTSSMIAVVLDEAQLHPSFLIGGELNEIGTNATWSDGDWTVVEADESDGTFLELSADIKVVTNVEPDHLDYFGSLRNLQAAFGRFLGDSGEQCVVCADDPVASSLAPQGALTYGFDHNARLRIDNFDGGRATIAFDLMLDRVQLGRFELPLAGEHNARNAAAAVGASSLVGAPIDAARNALARFAGVARRFEFRGEKNGITFVDDYAHLPTEIRANIAAARLGKWERVVCVFQPHRHSRTASIADQFAHCFDEADFVVVMAIYGAGETPLPGVSAQLIVDAVRAVSPSLEITYLPDRSQVLEYLVSHLHSGDCCLTLGAGDITSLADEILALPW